MPETKWADVRARLADADTADLLDLLRALFERSPENRRFLSARLRGSDSDDTLEEYRERIREEFAAGEAPRLGAARKVVRDYQKATGDVDGAVDLMLSFVEAGTDFARRHGDMGDAFFHSLALVLARAATALRRDDALYHRWRQRLEELRGASRRVGWTWGPHVAETVDELARRRG